MEIRKSFLTLGFTLEFSILTLLNFLKNIIKNKSKIFNKVENEISLTTTSTPPHYHPEPKSQGQLYNQHPSRRF